MLTLHIRLLIILDMLSMISASSIDCRAALPLLCHVA